MASVELTKQHFSTRIFRSYLAYIRTNYPEIDLKKLAESAGLPLSYVEDENNWVSVEFDRRFTEACISATGCQDLCFKVGRFANTEPCLGATAFRLGRYVLSLDRIYSDVAVLATRFLSRVHKLEVLRSSRGQITIRLIPVFDGLTETEIESFKENLTNIIENTKGYFSGFPLIHDKPFAKVTVENKFVKGNPVFDFYVSFPPSWSKAGIIANSFIVALATIGAFSYWNIGYAGTLIPYLAGMATFSIFCSLFFFVKSRNAAKALSHSDETLEKIDAQYSFLQETKESLQQKLLDWELIEKIIGNLAKAKTAKEVLQTSCDNITNVLKYDRVLIMTATQDFKEIEFGAVASLDPTFASKVRLFRQPIQIKSDDPKKISNVFRTGKSFLIENVHEHMPTLNEESQRVLKSIGSRSFLCVAIASESNTHGILCVDYYQSRKRLTQHDVELMETVARQIALALDKELAQEEAIHSLKRADKIKDEFLANTSHELRTPLHGIIGIVDSLLDGACGTISPELEENLSMISSSGRRLTHLVNDILDFSKMRNEEIVLNKKPIGVREMTEVVFTLLSPLSKAKGIQLKSEIPSELPAILADENRIQQVFVNLIGNAIKFTHAGSVQVRAYELDSSIQIQVIDTGKGIAKENFDVIFEAFKQEDGSSSREYGGTGLGLTITKKLIEAHAGTITVESEVGKGTTFTFCLPKTDAAATNSTHQRITRRRVEEDLDALDEIHEGHIFDNGRTILVVDDEPINLKVVSNLLQTKGYTVECANSGPIALEKIQNGMKPDIILLDVMMPGMTGYETCLKMRDTLKKAETPIIFLSAKDQTRDIVEGISVGANDYLVKPFSKDELFVRIESHLGLSQTVASYSRFVPFEFVSQLERGTILDVSLGDNVEKEMTVLFSDIRGFTELSARLTPIQIFEFLNHYFEIAAPIVHRCRGFIDKYMGDGLMAIFPGSPADAIQAAVEIKEAFQGLRLRHVDPKEFGVYTGFGINRGKLILGTIGYKRQMQGTVISNAVNVASRLESLTKELNVPILVSEDTLKGVILPLDFNVIPLGVQQLRGLKETIRVVGISKEGVENKTPSFKKAA